MAWLFTVVWIVSLVASYIMMPKPQSQPPPGLGDVTVPTAEEGREIPVLFGRRDLKGPNIVWYGNIRLIPVKKIGGKK